MGFNRVKNNFYPFGEYPEDRLIVSTPSTIEFNGTGAIPIMTFKLPIGKTAYVDMGDGTALKTVNGNDAIGVNVTHTYGALAVWTVTFSGDLDTITYYIWQGNLSIQGNVNDTFSTWVALTYLRLWKTTTTCNISSFLSVMPNAFTSLYLHDNGGTLSYPESITLPTSFKLIDIDDCTTITQIDLHRLINDVYTQRAGLPNNGTFDCSGTTVAIDATHAGYLDTMAATKAWTVAYN